MLIASCEPMGVPVRTAFLVGSLALFLLAANVVSIVRYWQPIGQRFDEFRAALSVIPRGARVIAFREDTGINPSLRPGPLYLYAQLPTLAVIERDAYVPFLSSIP